MTTLAEILVSILLVAGGFFGFVGSFGLIKLDETMKRLHSPTKSATLGVGAVLLASMLYNISILGIWSWHELLITLFVTLTAPLTGYFIAKANMHLHLRKAGLPQPSQNEVWATFSETGKAKETASV